VVGIPMGTNAAPNIANLYLYDSEAKYIDSLPLRVARAFHNTSRYIDDVLSVDNPLWTAALRDGLYHNDLSYNDTTLESGVKKVVNFLGMSIDARGGRLVTSVWDRRSTFPFPVRRYPHLHSLIPHNIPYGVFTGQLHRGYRLCTNVSSFVLFACTVAARLISNGCRRGRLICLFRYFVTHHVFHVGVSRGSIVRQFIDSLP
jgi:hypothetical protein